MSDGWIGVDLDGTLAFYDTWKGANYIGDPILPMLNRVKQWLSENREVKIFTARASRPEELVYVKKWLVDNGLPELEITNVKDFGMIELWDDRCVQVIPNTGQPITKSIWDKLV